MEYPGLNKLNATDVVVTAGGTREQIDDVRYVGNFSGGALGYAMAEELKSFDNSVQLLAPASVTDKRGNIPFVTHKQFTDCASLDKQLKSISYAKMVIHAAAVSDYTPVREPGKISSNQDELVVRMQRTPKILASLREHFGERSYLVGFKLLSYVSVDDLIETGKRQIETNKTDMCIANDLRDIDPATGRRKVYVINGHDNSIVPVEGKTQTVARHVASLIMVARQLKESHHE